MGRKLDSRLFSVIIFYDSFTATERFKLIAAVSEQIRVTYNGNESKKAFKCIASGDFCLLLITTMSG